MSLHRLGLLGLAAVALAVGAFSAARPAGAAGVTMTFTKVGYDPASGPTDPDCNAPLPSGNTASASYTAPDNSHTRSWEWTMPSTITAGATARTKVTVTANTTAGYSASIALKPALEFGTNADARQTITATVPVGQTGTKFDQENYTFTPSREFVAGEKLYVRIELGCANFIYEYTGIGGASACSDAPVRHATIAQDDDCKEKEIAAPPPGGVVRVTSPTKLGGSTNTGVTVSGNLTGTTVVAEGDEDARVRGEAVAQCWMLGPDALKLPPKLAKQIIKAKQNEKRWKQLTEDPAHALVFCSLIVRLMIKELRQNANPADSAANGCQVVRFAIRDRKPGRKVKLVPAKIKPSVRYKCTGVQGGIKLTAAGKLRKHLGNRLDLAVARHHDAPADGGRLTFGFGPG